MDKNNASSLIRHNRRLAKQVYPDIVRTQLQNLIHLTRDFRLSFERGELSLLQGKWYVTHTGLLGIARRKRCQGIHTRLEKSQSDAASCRWVFKAVVYKSSNSVGFVGYGDADPSNVSPLVRGAEMRIAETRAVNRALRKAYGIGLCSVEELGWSPKPADAISTSPVRIIPARTNGNGHPPTGQTRLRDQLCLLIRQYELDPNRVKAYAAHFCGTETIKEASRELVESFISHLAASAKEDRDGLICKLNSFPLPTQVQP